MAADLRLVAHAADRHPRELAAERPGDLLPERGLADSWRPHEAEDLAGDLVAGGAVQDNEVSPAVPAPMVGRRNTGKPAATSALRAVAVLSSRRWPATSIPSAL